MQKPFVSFTAVGAYHTANGTENQDAIFTGGNDRYRAAALADGVSTCPNSAAGAQLAAREAVKLFTERAEFFFAYAPADVARFTVDHVRCRLQAAADEAGCPEDALSSTLMCASYDRKNRTLLTLNLGDGLILGLWNGKLRVLSQPFNSAEGGGCCVTTTENAAAAAHVAFTNENLPDTVLLCTDGAWREMYGGAMPKPEVKAMLLSRDFGALGRFLAASGSFDDCSFVAMKL